jgi:hypothetical protein
MVDFTALVRFFFLMNRYFLQLSFTIIMYFAGLFNTENKNVSLDVAVVDNEKVSF